MISFKAYGQRGILMATKTSTFMEYLKIHLISLEQDKESISTNDEYSRCVVAGQIEATKHLLSVATDIMNNSNERYN
jgi:hypothetical protein